MKIKNRSGAVLAGLKGDVAEKEFIGQVKPDVNKGVPLFTSGWRLTYNGGQRFGFTLIELLVVVLIIGILASIAIPQYQKAVWKSRAAQLFTLTKNLATAQEAYFLENGNYATSFEEIILDFNNLQPTDTPIVPIGTSSSTATVSNETMELSLNVYSDRKYVFSTSFFKTGPYERSGFVFVHKSPSSVLEKKLYCVEKVGVRPKGLFCNKLWQTPQPVTTVSNTRFYELK